MKPKSLLLTGLAGIVALALLTGCSGKQTKGAEALKRDQGTASTQQEIYAASQPVPVYDWSQSRSTLIAVQNAKAGSIAGRILTGESTKLNWAGVDWRVIAVTELNGARTAWRLDCVEWQEPPELDK